MRSSKKILFAVLIAAVATAAICYLIFYKLNSQDAGQKSAEKAVIIQPKSYVQLLFVGDLMFDRGIRYYARENGGNEFIFDKISAVLFKNDLVVANLEGPITDNKSVSAGTAPGSAENYFFTFDPSVAETLFDENIRLVNLGNNHILNFGYEGLGQTQKYLDEARVGYFGSPNYPKSISTEISGIKITFISYNEFSDIRGLEGQATTDQIQKAKGFSDIIILFCHWGVEYAKNPTEAQKELAHQFIDAGADLIIGSHPHVIQDPGGAPEEYNGKRIYYSLGNFIFDQYFNEDVRNGLGVVLKIDTETKQFKLEEINFYLDSNGQTVIKN